MSSSGDKKAKKKRERERDLRESTGCGFRKDLVADRHLDDQRYERSRAANAPGNSVAAATMPAAAIPGLTQGGPPASATMDTIMRMQAGLGLRTIADNINDPNRPTWEEYKKAKADKLDLVGEDQRRMLEYRKQLDAEREKRLAQNRGENVKKDKKKKSKKHKKESKKKKKKKDERRKSKKRKRFSSSSSDASSSSSSGSSDGSDDDDGRGEEEEGDAGEEGAGGEAARKEDRKRKSRKKKGSGGKKKKRRRDDEASGGSEDGGGSSSDGGSGSELDSSGPVQLSSFLRKGGGSESESD